MIRLQMKIQYGINTGTAKISVLYSGKVDKYKCLASEKILPSEQSRIIEQARILLLVSHFKYKQKQLKIKE